MPTLLSCTDGSIYARSVYEHTAWVARRLEAAVHVLHILEPPRDAAALADLSDTIGAEAQASLAEEFATLEALKARVAQTHAQAILADAKRQLRTGGVQQLELEATPGELTDSIERCEAAADLIVIGKRGEHADFGKLHLGSNVERVIRSSHRPVLVAARAFNRIERVLFAFDGGPSALAAVAFATASPLLRGLHLRLLLVGPSTPEIRDSLEAARARLLAAGHEVQADVLPGEPEKVIAEAVRRESIHLLVMGAYGHTRIRELTVGSTTATMVRTCLVPVLLFR